MMDFRNGAAARKTGLLLALICMSVSVGACDEDDALVIPPEPGVTVLVDVTPDSTIFEWTLSGPDQYSYDGKGDETVTDLAVGEYGLAWKPTGAYLSPQPALDTAPAAAGDTVTFRGTYVLPEPPELPSEFLFLGSSYFATNDLPDIFRKFAEAQGYEVHIESFVPLGKYLDYHAGNQISEDMINLRDWDFVILQGVGPVVAYPEDASFDLLTALNTLEEKIHNNNPETKMMFCMPWAFEDGMTWTPGGTDTYFDMQLHIYNNTLALAEEVDLVIAPVGWAFNGIMLRDETPLHYLYQSDWNHPSIKGSYLMSCVIYCSVFKEAVGVSPVFGKILPAEAAMFQDTAAGVVLDELILWHLE